MRAVVVAISPSDRLPWWWEEVKRDPQLCSLDHVRINFRGKRGRQISTLELPLFMLKALALLFSFRRKYDYVFTVEADLIGLSIAFWQSLLMMRKPRHVILQFIMREKTPGLASRMKYALMRFVFRSVYRVICSSKAETAYYREMFSWDATKARFIPILTSAAYLEAAPTPGGDYLLAAGRSFRDYETAVAAVQGTPFRIVIVGGRGLAAELGPRPQLEVIEEIPLDQLSELIRNSAAVVVPLHDRRISIGQSVLLQAMAMGKLVIATRTSGTEDYVDHMVNGLLVTPGSVSEMQAAMAAAADDGLRRRLGQRARNDVAAQHLPHHFTAAVRKVLA